MLTIAQSPFRSTAQLLKHAIDTASYYGFVPLEHAPNGASARLSPVSKIKPSDLCFMHKQERALLPVVHSAAARGLGSPAAPAFLWKLGGNTKTGVALELHVIGVPATIAEALLISVGRAIATDAGIDEQIVRVNSIGATDSSARFARELGVYLRKHAGDIPPAIAASLATDPIGVFAQLVEKQAPIIEKAPQSMEFLNEDERGHLWGVLEYLEAADTFYELDPFVLGSRDCWTHTLFELRGKDKTTNTTFVFARGGRYDALASQCCGGSASGTTLTIHIEQRGAAVKLPQHTQLTQSPLYFAHLGKEAKQKALPLLENLRHAGISVGQSLVYDQLSEQMAAANKRPLSHLMIMGYKEAMEGTVLVRELASNAQVAVPTPEVVAYLKRRRIGVVV